MATLTKKQQAGIKKELAVSYQIFRLALLKDLEIQDSRIPSSDLRGVIKFGEFKTSILQTMIAFEEKNLQENIESCMDRITDKAGQSTVDNDPAICPECQEQLPDNGKCESACCKESRV